MVTSIKPCSHHYYVHAIFYRSPEFFYPNVFVKIKETVPETSAVTNISSVVFHATHPKEILDICQDGYAIFKGRLKQWRLLDNQTYFKQCCSYLVQPRQRPIPMEQNNSTPFGPFVWFGTNRDETDKYGPCQFEFSLTSVLRAYQTCRKSYYQRICYRAAGTLVYKYEVCHIIMICCLEDDECQKYPLITANNTRYFKPPNALGDDGDNGPPVGLQFETTRNNYQETERHENVTFALYLPNSRNLYLSHRDGKMKMTSHKRYCIKSRNEVCDYEGQSVFSSIEKLIIIARWVIQDNQEEEPVHNAQHSVLNQSLNNGLI